MSNNQLQNEEMYLPGDLGTVTFGLKKGDVTSVFNSKDGVTTLTIQPQKDKIEVIDTRDCFFDVAKIEKRMKDIGMLEDIDHEVIEPKHLL